MNRGLIGLGIYFLFLGLTNAALADATVKKTPVRFCESFTGCRNQFVTLTQEALVTNKKGKHWQAKIDDWKADKDLQTDFVFLPNAQDKDCLMVVSSGVHGVEGYTGSYIQSLMLNEQASDIVGKGCSILFIHGINAHGFKHRNRYTERRTDLNRTWFTGKEFPKNLDDGGYAKFDSLFNPKTRVGFGNIDFTKFLAMKLVPWVKSATSGALTKAAGIGQYTFPQGIIYGGNDFSPHRAMVMPVLQHYFKNYRRVIGIDLHTGLGRRELQLLPNPPYDKEIGELRKKVFEVKKRKIEDTGGVDFYASHGDFSDFLCQLYKEENNGGKCVSMLLEVGTLKSTEENPGTITKVKNFKDQAYTLYLTVRENQLYHHDRRSKHRNSILKAWSDLFYPSDEKWRQMVSRESRELIPAFVDQFLKEVP